MTEQEWLTSVNTARMMIHLGNQRKLSERKQELFFCSLWRLAWDKVSESGRRYIVTKEMHADGLVSEDDLRNADRAQARSREFADAFAVIEGIPAKETALLRHIYGNPFRPYPVPESWPATVTQLANALYNGENCGFALHDALLEAGHPELAEHFRQEQNHPKGCWVIDVVLGRG